MNRKLIGRTVLYGVCGIFVLVFIFVHHGVGTIFALKRANTQLQKNIDVLKIKNKQLESEIAGWERCPFYKEQMAREQLQLAYLDDIIYYVI